MLFIRMSYVRLLSLGGLHPAGCRVSVIGLCVACASPCWMSRASYGWLPEYLVRVARLTIYINGSMP